MVCIVAGRYSPDLRGLVRQRRRTRRRDLAAGDRAGARESDPNQASPYDRPRTTAPAQPSSPLISNLRFAEAPEFAGGFTFAWLPFPFGSKDDAPFV